MAFSGNPQVREVSDGMVRISGVSLAQGGTGTIGLHESSIPFVGGGADVRLPEAFRPRAYDYAGSHGVTLQDAIQASYVTVYTAPMNNVRYALVKSGGTPAAFLITLINLSNGPSSILGTAQSFAVLASASVDNAFGGTTVEGDVGVSPGAIVTGFPPGTVDGDIHAADDVAAAAMRDAVIAYEAFAAMVPTQNLTGQDLGGLTLGPGIYRFDGDANLDGTLELDTQGDPNAFWIFQIAGNLTMANDAVVDVDDANTVYWQIGGSAAFGTTSQAAGTYIAMSEVVHQSATVLPGRVIALTGSVSLSDCTVSVPDVPSGFQQSSSGPFEIYIRYH